MCNNVKTDMNRKVATVGTYCFVRISTRLLLAQVIITFFAALNYDCFNNKVYCRLSYDVETFDVDRDVSTAYC